MASEDGVGQRDLNLIQSRIDTANNELEQVSKFKNESY